MKDIGMRSIGSDQTVFFNPAIEFEPDYLGAAKGTHQPLCGNIEGWGPLSPFRYDFTPCFLDVWISAVAVFGIVFGTAAIWYLMKKKTPQLVGKNWHFYTKLVQELYSLIGPPY